MLTIAGADGLTLGRETMKPVYEFIDKHQDEPLLIWFAPMLPHSPFYPLERYLTLCKGKGMSESAQKYYASCTRLDDFVGQLIRYLDEKGLRQNTLYDKQKDPKERFKAIGNHPNFAKRFKQEIHKWKEEVIEGIKKSD